MEAARAAHAADAPRLAELCRDAVADLGAHRGGPQLIGEVLDGRTAAEALDAAMGDPATLVVAGELDGVVLGFAVATAAGLPPVARIRALWVDPEARAVGLGEAILLAVVSWASARACTGIEAAALPGARHSKSFFETNGMVARALVMHRSLP